MARAQFRTRSLAYSVLECHGGVAVRRGCDVGPLPELRLPTGSPPAGHGGAPAVLRLRQPVRSLAPDRLGPSLLRGPHGPAAELRGVAGGAPGRRRLRSTS